MKHQTIDLETFLESLPTEAAANARAAAARIDELEHAAQRIGKSDRQYVIAFTVSVVLALIATYMALGGYSLFTGGYGKLGDLLVLAMAGAFPVMIFIYSLRMRERTKLDQKKFDLIETYFMPHDGIYFPPSPGRETGTVSISPKGSLRKPNTNDIKKARMYW
jgi:heme/copper-type cytochrome/quinol oxidase subunit 4